jgi:ABC-2 type transport system ATP-binding protein
MIEIANVTKKYGKTLANDDVSLTVESGEAGILLGPNGAGKSTLIKCLCGLLRFDGEITLDGHRNRTSEAKRILGYVPESPSVYDLLTVSEHLEFIQRAYRVEEREYAQSLLRRFMLDDKTKKLGKELSKGMQQKLSVCCALVHRPSVVVFDEPLVGLDPHAIKEWKKLLSELKESGATVLISTHMIDSVEEQWDVAHILVRGRIAATKRRDEGGRSLEDLFFAVTENDEDGNRG